MIIRDNSLETWDIVLRNLTEPWEQERKQIMEANDHNRAAIVGLLAFKLMGLDTIRIRRVYNDGYTNEKHTIAKELAKRENPEWSYTRNPETLEIWFDDESYIWFKLRYG